MKRAMLILSALLITPLAASAGPEAPVQASPVDAQQAEPTKKKRRATTGIEWQVAPKTVLIILNGKKLGRAGDLKITKTRPGKHEVKLVNGEDETEMDINVNKGQVLKFAFVFEDG